MKKYTKRLFSLMMAAVMLFGFTVTGFALDSSVTFEANEKKFDFMPGTEYSLSDLFPDFKNMMPGDTRTQTVTVKNNGKDGHTTKIYMKALGPSEEFNEVDKTKNQAVLGQLNMSVVTRKDTKSLFSATADKTDGLTDWVLLGSLRKGGEVVLDVTVSVPVTMGNEFRNVAGGIKWAFKVEEIPDPVPENPLVPDTGDTTNTMLYGGIFAVSAAALVCLVVLKKKREE